MNMVLAALAAVAFGTGDFLGGLAARGRHWLVVVFTAQLSAVAAAVTIASFDSRVDLSSPSLLWASLAGVSFAVGVGLLYKALGEGEMSRVAPLTALFAIAVPTLFDLLTGEPLGYSTLFGIALSIPAIMLIGNEGGARAGASFRLVLTAICAGLGLASFYICLKQTDPAGGLWLIVITRLVTCICAGVSILVVSRSHTTPIFPLSKNALAAGFLDGVATSLVLLATSLGPLSVAAALSSLYPVMTIFLALVILKERMSLSQKIGTALAGVSLVAILS